MPCRYMANNPKEMGRNGKKNQMSAVRRYWSRATSEQGTDGEVGHTMS